MKQYRFITHDVYYLTGVFNLQAFAGFACSCASTPFSWLLSGMSFLALHAMSLHVR